MSDWGTFFSDKISDKDDVYHVIYDKIHQSVKNNAPECILFEVSNNPYIITVEQKDYKVVLDKCLEYFAKIEEYELCESIKETIEKNERYNNVG